MVAEPPDRPEPPEPRPRIRTFRAFLIELGTITTGVLIALLLEGLLDWNHNRELVQEARATIAREIAENKKDLDNALAGISDRQKDIANALAFAEQMVRDKKSSITTLALRYELADLSTASWETAERTGALAHMDYGEVRDLSMLYGYQQLFAERQRRIVDRVAEATSLFAAGDPHRAAPQDLEMFRQRVLALRGDLAVQEDFARQLSANYAKLLAK